MTSSLSNSPIVNATLLVLIALSIITWAVIILKSFQFWTANRDNRIFAKKFWSSSNMDMAAGLTQFKGAMSRLSNVGFNTLVEAGSLAYKDLLHTGDKQELLERSLKQQLQRENNTLENGLTILASIGSTAPFIGLFGTVWGIMHALQDISKLGSATLDVVSGPIGEALIATAIGIATAIPAVLAYNYFLRKIKILSAELDNFAADFFNLSIKSGFKLDKDNGNYGVSQFQRPTNNDERNQRNATGGRDASVVSSVHHHSPAANPSGPG